MHEARFVNLNGNEAAIVEEAEYDNGGFERGGDVRIFKLSNVSCLTAIDTGGYMVTLDCGDDFYVTKGDFERLAAETLGHNVDADDPWN